MTPVPMAGATISSAAFRIVGVTVRPPLVPGPNTSRAARRPDLLPLYF
jgi:hypothetical protein